MLELPHVAVGAAIATKIPNPLLAIPLAFASHFVLDKIPHWNPHIYKETKKFGQLTKKSTKIIILDSSLALILGLLIASLALPSLNRAMVIIAASFASVLPDFIEAPYFFLNMRGNEFLKKWITFHRSLQKHVSFLPGILSQIIVLAAALYWIFS